jgi:hypothetical protein
MSDPNTPEQVGRALVAAGFIHRSEAQKYGTDILSALREAGYEVVKLPEWPGCADVGVIAIDMEPDADSEYAGGPFLVARFEGIDKPGRLFDRRPLAAALLAAARAAEERAQ